VTLTLSVNGVEIASVQDSSDPYEVGSVGVTAAGHAGLDVRFDNFEVRQA
jgi:hypothetical protein